jgi:hypothetical protein
MTRKTWFISTAILLLAGLSLYINRDWFGSDDIHIYDRSMPARAMQMRRRAAEPGPANPVIFGFNRELKLTSIKVVPVSALETNRFAHPVWHLVSSSNSAPTKSFPYGAPMRGMRPAIPGAQPDPLQPNIRYRLLIEAEGFKGQHDFEPKPRTP